MMMKKITNQGTVPEQPSRPPNTLTHSNQPKFLKDKHPRDQVMRFQLFSGVMQQWRRRRHGRRGKVVEVGI